jgi:nitrate/nitrite transport system permease protein
MRLAPGIRAPLASLLLLAVLLAVWHLATLPPAAGQNADADYAALVGAPKSGLPGPTQIAQAAWQQLKSPFRNGGMNDKGIAIQLAWSLGRVLLGFAIAMLVAVPVGFFVGSSPFAYRALNPFIQVLKPISPLAWMPLALYTIKDSSICSIFVIAICSVWPMLVNTAHGVGSVKRDWLDVARTLEVRPLRKGLQILLPAAAPTILTGMRISMGIAWLVIVAAEMLVGGTGIGYFVWNEWNNLSLANVIFALAVIGLTGMLLDLGFAGLGRLVAYQE